MRTPAPRCGRPCLLQGAGQQAPQAARGLAPHRCLGRHPLLVDHPTAYSLFTYSIPPAHSSIGPQPESVMARAGAATFGGAQRMPRYDRWSLLGPGQYKVRGQRGAPRAQRGGHTVQLRAGSSALRRLRGQRLQLPRPPPRADCSSTRPAARFHRSRAAWGSSWRAGAARARARPSGRARATRAPRWAPGEHSAACCQVAGSASCARHWAQPTTASRPPTGVPGRAPDARLLQQGVAAAGRLQHSGVCRAKAVRSGESGRSRESGALAAAPARKGVGRGWKWSLLWASMPLAQALQSHDPCTRPAPS